MPKQLKIAAAIAAALTAILSGFNALQNVYTSIAKTEDVLAIEQKARVEITQLRKDFELKLLEFEISTVEYRMWQIEDNCNTESMPLIVKGEYRLLQRKLRQLQYNFKQLDKQSIVY